MHALAIDALSFATEGSGVDGMGAERSLGCHIIKLGARLSEVPNLFDLYAERVFAAFGQPGVDGRHTGCDRLHVDVEIRHGPSV